MALFSFKKKKSAEGGPASGGKKVAPTPTSGEPAATDKKNEAKVAPKTPVAVSEYSDLSHVLRNPRITEKATMHQETGVYTFDVSEGATKRLVALAVASLYKVTPRQVRIVAVPSKEKRNARTGARGISRGGKKAYVYLKKGETITIT